jgi:Fe-S-cluster containining protein
MKKKSNSGRTGKKEAPANRLPDGLAAAELDARRAERLDAVETLKAGRTPLNVIEVAERASALAEKAVENFKASYPPPAFACREGCDWCCHLNVAVTAAEVFRIADYLRHTLSPQDMDATRVRLARLDDERRRLPANQRAGARLPCALLVDHRCLAYPVRPLTCRGFNSSDAHQCELFLDAPRRVRVPNYVPQLRLMTFVLDGMRAGLSECGLKGDLCELTGALCIALTVPDAARRWLAGEAVFAPARLNW